MARMSYEEKIAALQEKYAHDEALAKARDQATGIRSLIGRRKYAEARMQLKLLQQTLEVLDPEDTDSDE